MAETLNVSLQQSVLTLLAYDDKAGRVIANMVNAELFEGDYADVARQSLAYWKKHSAPPRHHLDDMLGTIISDAKNPKGKTLRTILNSMLQLYDAGLNTAYYVDEVYKFQELQGMKRAILESANKINARSDAALDEVKDIWADLLRRRKQTFDAGLQLTDITPVLSYFEAKHDEFMIGIPELDRRHIAPMRDAVLLLLGATGMGKSWGLVHIGKHALLQRKKVLHVSLEMPKEEVIQRYWQSLFSMSRGEANHKVTTITRDKFDRLAEINKEQVDAEFAFNSPFVQEELTTRLMWQGKNLQDNLRVISYPSGSLSARDLAAYLDALAQVTNFVPDMVIVDYIGLMKIDSTREFRHALGHNMVLLRGIASERHVAMVTAQQVSRVGAGSKTIAMTHIAEDWSLTNTADMILAYSCTAAERQLGLGRLYVAKARNAADKFGVLLTQNYGLGQFILDSVLLDKKYDTLLSDMGKADDDIPEDDENEDEDIGGNY